MSPALTDRTYVLGKDITPLTLSAGTGGTGTAPRFRYTLSGEPTAAGTNTLTYSVEDAASGREHDLTFTIAIVPNGVPSFGAALVENQTYTVGTAIDSLTLPPATGGNGTLTYTLTGPNGTDLSKVPGLRFNPATRILSGTPTADTASPVSLAYTATDGDADSVTLEIAITVAEAAANVLPVADAGPAQSVATGAVVTLDGSDSNDPDGDSNALTYAWSHNNQGITLNSPTTAQPTFRALNGATAKTLTFSLMVTDTRDGASTNSAQVTITVAPAANPPSFGTQTIADQTLVVES